MGCGCGKKKIEVVRAEIRGGVLTRTGAEHRANGGPVEAGASYIVGERGPELFVPEHRGGVLRRVPAK